MAVNRVIAKEDGNLVTSIITTRDQVYKDIDLSFTAKENGELYVKRDAAAVKQAVKNLILTNYFEKPFQPFFGSDVRSLLFELADDEIEDDIEEAISNAIKSYEPRALLRRVTATSIPDQNSINVYIEFQIINTSETVTINTTLSRLR